MTVHLYVPFILNIADIEFAVNSLFNTKSIVQDANDDSFQRVIFQISDYEIRHLHVYYNTSNFDEYIAHTDLRLNSWGTEDIIIKKLAEYFSGWIVKGDEKIFIEKSIPDLTLTNSQKLYIALSKDPELKGHRQAIGPIMKWIYNHRNLLQELKFGDV